MTRAQRASPWPSGSRSPRATGSVPSRKGTTNSAARAQLSPPFLRLLSDARDHPSSEVFVSDQTSSLFAVDTRNGRVIYGYKGALLTPRAPFIRADSYTMFCQGIAGAVTSMAPSPAGLISTALDRYARVHSTYPPPAEAGQPQSNKGTVLEKVYLKSTPTCVIWDEVAGEDADDGDGMRRDGAGADSDGSDADIWEGMQEAEDSGDESGPQVHRRRKGPK